VLATGVANGYQPVDPKTVFTAADKWVYLVYQVADVPADSSFQITWIAVDVRGLGHNYEVSHDHCDCNYKTSADRVGYFALGSPPGGFLAGSYSADLYLDGALIGSYPFDVQ